MKDWRRVTESLHPDLHSVENSKTKNIYTIEAGMLLKTKTTVTECAINGGLSCPKTHRLGGHRGVKSSDEPRKTGIVPGPASRQSEILPESTRSG